MVERYGRGRNGGIITMNKKINAGLKITGIGCGQCGTQIIAEIEKAVNLLDGDKSNLSFIGINTSTEDLSSVTLSHKIHINNSKGAACDRNKSTEALADGIDEILEELQSYIIEDSIIFIAFSCGGGTGSAIAPILSGILKEMGYTVGMIPVLPADTEPLKVRDNARLTFNEIEELKPGMGSIFILDNNASDKITVNKVFASLFTGILCINNKSQDGNMDLAEIEACLKCPSFSVITKTNAIKGTTANIIDILNKENNIFAKREDKTVTIMGISEAVSAKDSKIDIIQLRKEIGTAPTEFHGYLSESEENVIILSGLTMPYSRVDTMTESIEKEAVNVQNSMKALTEVRTAKSLDIFGQKAEPVATSPKTKGLSALEALKARRITK
jgi:hypothetical protein